MSEACPPLGAFYRYAAGPLGTIVPGAATGKGSRM